jgi:hypothetical protein
LSDGTTATLGLDVGCQVPARVPLWWPLVFSVFSLFACPSCPSCSCVVATQRLLTQPERAMAAGVDVNTQQSFEALNQRAVAVVVDPIQSVKGKVVIDAFRSINPQMTMMGYEPRQTTSIIGHLNKPSIQALIHGLNRHYYSIAISYRKSELEEKMLMNLHKKGWTEGLKTADFKQHDKQNEETVKRMLDLAKAYNKAVQEEDEKTAEKFQIDQVRVSRLLSSLPSSSVSGSCPKPFRGARMFPAHLHLACFAIRCSRCHYSPY